MLFGELFTTELMKRGHTGEPTFVGLMHTDSTSLFDVTKVLYLALFSF